MAATRPENRTGTRPDAHPEPAAEPKPDAGKPGRSPLEDPGSPGGTGGTGGTAHDQDR